MAVPEIYIKLSVLFPSDQKVRALAQYGPDAGLARDLYVQMVLHCKSNLTDGFVAEYELPVLVHPLDGEHGKQLAKQLASVGLIKESSKDQANGWHVLAYLRRNGSREDVERLSKVRAEAGRAGGRATPKTARQGTRKANSKQSANQDAQANGSNAVSVSVSVNSTETDTEIQTPQASAANGLTITQRSKRLTDAYAEVVPLCNWSAVNGIVIKAIKAERYSDLEIREALLRMAADNRPVTVDSLRTELGGMPPARSGTPRPSTTDQRVADAQALKARLAGRLEITP